MNWLDVVILLALLASTIVGLLQGLISTLASLVGTIVGVLLASRFYEQVAGLLPFISNRGIANIIAFVIILLAVIIVAALIGSALKAVITAIKLGCVDRALGGVLGLFLGIVFISALLAGYAKFFGEASVSDSSVARILLDRFPIVMGLLPSQFGSVRDFFKSLH